MVANSEDFRCAYCGKSLVGEDRFSGGMAVYVLDSEKPDQLSFPVGLEDQVTTFVSDGTLRYREAGVCSSSICVKGLLDKMVLNNDDWPSLFRDTKGGPGGWWGPGGCIHYLKTVYQTVANLRPWLEYSYRWSFEDLRPELMGLWEKSFEMFEGIEPVIPSISLVGGYGSLMDGCFHFCNALCVLENLFPHIFPSTERPLASLISYSGFPSLPMPEESIIFYSDFASIRNIYHTKPVK